MSFLQIFVVVFILCPVPYIYFYLYLTDTSESNEYDVYYTLHGRKQKPPDDCSKCLSAVTPDAQVIDPQCIAHDYKCSIKLALQSVVKSYDYINHNLEEYHGKYRRRYAPESTFVPVSMDGEDDPHNNGNLYGVSPLPEHEYDYLMGEWRISSIIHNHNYVWTKYDKYRRHLKLFLYDNYDNKRWIVGHNLSSDAAYIYSPLNEDTGPLKKADPINIIHDAWLYHNATIKVWKQLHDFRFSPSPFTQPQIQSISVKNHSVIDMDKDTVISFTWTHVISLNEDSALLIYKEGELYQTIAGSDAQHVTAKHDKVLLSNLTLPHNKSFAISFEENLVYPVQPNGNKNGNAMHHNVIVFETREQKIRWNSVAAQYLRLAEEIVNATLDEDSAGNEKVEMNLLISFLNSVLFIDDSDGNYSAFNRDIGDMSSYLQAKKQLIINRNDSSILQLLKAQYYLKLSQLNSLKGYHYLLLGDEENAKKYIDKSLRICVKQYYGSKIGKKVKFVDGLIALNQYNHYYCNFHSYDTYEYLLNNHNDHYDVQWFVKTIKLRWIMREYTLRYSDDLLPLFGSGPPMTSVNTRSGKYKSDSHHGLHIDNLNNKVEFQSCHPPRYDILFGLRNLQTIRLQFARYGVVQAKNLLSLVECKWLANHYTTQASFRSTNDRISYVYLQDLGEIMSYIVGHSVKKSYSQFVNFNNTNFYVKNIAETLREDNTYSMLLTINQRDTPQYPFPIYIHKQVVMAQKKKFHFTNYKQNYEFINNIGDAIVFKGTQHIHFAPYTRTLQAHNYWVILFHFVDLDYDFVDYKKRFQLHNGAI
eukprot:136820_1